MSPLDPAATDPAANQPAGTDGVANDATVPQPAGSDAPAPDAAAAEGVARSSASSIAFVAPALDGLSDLALAEHPDVYQHIHTELKRALAAIDDA